MHPTEPDKKAMSAYTYDKIARYRLETIEKGESWRTGKTLQEVRPEVAEKIGILPGTADGVRRGRSKGVRLWIAKKITKAFVRELQEEMLRLSHELQLVYQSGERPDSDEVAKIRAAHAALAGLIEEAK